MSSYIAVNVESGLTANGTTIAGTTILDYNSQYHIIGTCTSTNYVVRLGGFKTGVVHKIKNTGAYPALILPLNSSSILDGLNAGVGFYLAQQSGEVDIIAVSNDNAATPVITYRSFNKMGIPIIDLTTTYTVLAQDNYAVYTLDSAGGAYTITMPAPTTRGLRYRFRVKEDTPTGAITIDCGAGLLDGNVIPRNGTAIVDTGKADAAQNIVIGTSALLGTFVEVESDGVSWLFWGAEPLSNATSSITCT